MKNGVTTSENSLALPQKVIYRSVNSKTNYMLMRNENIERISCETRNFTQIFIATLLRDRCVNKPILSLNEWISKRGMSTGWSIIWPKN